jgi:hypothetical protein
MSRDDAQPKLLPGSLRNHLKSKGRSRRQEMNRLGQARVKRSGMRDAQRLFVEPAERRGLDAIG